MLNLLVRFFHDRNGSGFPVAVAILGGLFLLSALALDGGRMMMAQWKLDQGVEAAAAAVAAYEGHTLDERHHLALPAFRGHVPPGLMGTRLKPLRVAAAANGQIEIVGKAVMPTRFLALLGVEEISLDSARWVLPRAAYGEEKERFSPG